MKKVLFVCLGNICRSPLAEAIFAHKVSRNEWQADSAGTGAYHIGSDPDRRSMQVARHHGVPIAHKARQFHVEDFARFDYIIAMDRQNYRDILSLTSQPVDNVYLMRDFDDHANGDKDVPDPYYGGDDGFQLVYEMLDRSIDKLVAHIQKHQ